MVYMSFSKWHLPSLGSTIPPSFPSPAKWKPASVEKTNKRVTFLQPMCSWEGEEKKKHTWRKRMKWGQGIQRVSWKYKNRQMRPYYSTFSTVKVTENNHILKCSHFIIKNVPDLVLLVSFNDFTSIWVKKNTHNLQRSTPLFSDWSKSYTY